MKKFLFMSAIAACMGLMTSCVQEDDIPTCPTGIQNIIVFSTNSNVGITRSGQTTNSLNKFTVSAVNADKTAYFNSVEFNFDFMDGAFKSSTPYYWPVESSLSFYAISNPGSVSFDANSAPQYAYTNWGGETDLVAATVLAGNKQIPYPLVFQHILSQVSVSAEAKDKSEHLTYKLTSVEMTTPCDGTYSFADATGGMGTWDIDYESGKEYSFADAFPLSFNETGSVNSGSIYWNILPVTNGKIKFKVGYQVFQNGKMIADFTGSKAKDCVVDNPNHASGKRYVYNFKLTRGSNDVITFTTTLINWDESENAISNDVPDNNESTGNITIPRPIAGATSSITTEAGVNLYESDEYDWSASYTANELSLLQMNTPSLALGNNEYNYADIEVDGILYSVKIIDYSMEPIKADNGDTIELRFGSDKWYASCCGENYMTKSQSSHQIRFVGCKVNGVSYQIECN